MRVLFLSPRQCWPPVTGARLREYHFLLALSETMETTYIFFGDPGSPGPTAADLPFCAELIPVARPAMYTPGKLVRGLVGTQPLTLLNYTSRAMADTIRSAMARKRYDLVHFDSIHMANYQSLAEPEVPVFYNWHNIESEAMARFAKNGGSPIRQLYSNITASRLARLERKILADAAGHLVCSERERLALKDVDESSRVAVVENGVDVDYFASSPRQPDRNRIVFVGSMNYHANADAAVDFARNVWPLILRRFPAWRLTLVGSSPGPAVLALGQLPNVEVTGTVPDVRPYYREAIASVVPLRVGGGTRLKILEAMAVGVPVVSTALGAEGLAAVPGKNILLAEADADWLPALESLVSIPEMADSLVENARTLVASRYDWKILRNLIGRIYGEWTTSPHPTVAPSGAGIRSSGPVNAE